MQGVPPPAPLLCTSTFASGQIVPCAITTAWPFRALDTKKNVVFGGGICLRSVGLVSAAPRGSRGSQHFGLVIVLFFCFVISFLPPLVALEQRGPFQWCCADRQILFYPLSKMYADVSFVWCEMQHTSANDLVTLGNAIDASLVVFFLLRARLICSRARCSCALV